MECYKLVEGGLRRVDDPARVVPGLTAGAFLKMAGYARKPWSGHAEHTDSMVDVYQTERRGLPAYYVALSGPRGAILGLVADSVVELRASLQHLQRLLGRSLADAPASPRRTSDAAVNAGRFNVGSSRTHD